MAVIACGGVGAVGPAVEDATSTALGVMPAVAVAPFSRPLCSKDFLTFNSPSMRARRSVTAASSFAVTGAESGSTAFAGEPGVSAEANKTAWWFVSLRVESAAAERFGAAAPKSERRRGDVEEGYCDLAKSGEFARYL